MLLSLQNRNGRYYPDKHSIQGMIYTALGETMFGKAHDKSGFKYFTYSDFFYDRRGRGSLIISSPYPGLIETILEWTRARQVIRLGTEDFVIKTAKVLAIKVRHEFQSGSPILLYRDSQSGEFFSFRKHGDISFFLDRLKDNALKKYEFFTGTRLDIEGPIFDEVELRREIAVPVNIRGQDLVFIGTMWKSLVKHDIEEFREFYHFLMETGLGEKNSLGFGFINPIRGG